MYSTLKSSEFVSIRKNIPFLFGIISTLFVLHPWLNIMIKIAGFFWVAFMFV